MKLKNRENNNIPIANKHHLIGFVNIVKIFVENALGDRIVEHDEVAEKTVGDLHSRMSVIPVSAYVYLYGKGNPFKMKAH